MKDFREMLTERDRTTDSHSTHRSFNRLDFGRYSASIQASEFHYCTPRGTLAVGDHSYSAWDCARVPR